MLDKGWVQYNARQIQHYSLRHRLFDAADFPEVLTDISNLKTLTKQPRIQPGDDTTPHWVSIVRGILPAVQKVQKNYGVQQRDQQENYRTIFASVSE